MDKHPPEAANTGCRQFEARLTMLPETAQLVEAFCARHAVPPDTALKIVLVVEELFTNSVRHGYGGDCAAPIAIALHAREHDVLVVYEDEAPAHDPLSTVQRARAALARPAKDRQPGGLGVLLVDGICTSARYARERGRNRVWLTVGRA
jgi:anti-sigma regulatory factor (Ser/Thr protein kinase)